MKSDGIHLQHAIRIGSTPLHAKQIAVHKSEPLSVMLIHMLKHSDNLYANAITKTLGHLHSGQPASWDDGVNAIKTILSTQAHLNKKNLDFMDGAGISRYNLTTPQSIAHLLQFIQKTPSVAKYLIPALPIAGHDGTLTNRMKNLYHNESFRAKTGTLTGVSNLAGYLTTRNNKHYIVVILADNFTSKANSIREIEDKMVLALANQ